MTPALSKRSEGAARYGRHSLQGTWNLTANPSHSCSCLPVLTNTGASPVRGEKLMQKIQIIINQYLTVHCLLFSIYCLLA